jgi:hypothetical protein
VKDNNNNENKNGKGKLKRRRSLGRNIEINTQWDKTTMTTSIGGSPEKSRTSSPLLNRQILP